MRLTSYILSRYFMLFGSISVLLTTLFNLIELFEKAMRTQAGMAKVTTFIGLNLIPSWLMLFSVSSWLAILACISFLQVQSEWKTCLVLGIRPKKIIVPFFISLCCVALLILGAKHLFLDDFQAYRSNYHQKVFKHKNPNLILDKWFWLPQNQYAHVATYNQGSQKGKNLMLYQFTTDCQLIQTLHTDSWVVAEDTIKATGIKEYNARTSRERTLEYRALPAPALCHALAASKPPASWALLFSAWAKTPSAYSTQKATLGTALYAHLLPVAESIILPSATLSIYLINILRSNSPLLLAVGVYPVWLLVKGALEKCLG